ncbi:hypothetical protein EVAR_26512_1 [Eumeta japonica]|uniref:Mos1 transposase HTH domain-containing protein n=1 Tax=Eumeta variegata TaxID=151549 RepID=A0A4C1V7S9_EUMVA|nr:hypothetical protein EVAR_26512_1 [Eumeta japonica]
MKHHARKLFIYNWFAKFKRDHVNLSDEFRDGRPSKAVINKNIDAVRRMIETDRHVTYHEIRASLGIGLINNVDAHCAAAYTGNRLLVYIYPYRGICGTSSAHKWRGARGLFTRTHLCSLSAGDRRQARPGVW